MRAKYFLVSSIVLVVWLLSPGLAVSDEIENLVRGGDFEEDADLNQWGLDAKNSISSMTRDENTAAIGESSLYIEITQLDPEAGWVPNPTQHQHSFESRATYTYAAFLKAEETKQITMNVKQDGGEWRSYISETFSVGTEWEEFWFTFEAQEDAPSMMLEFNNSSSLVNYWIDGVRFYEGEYEPYIPQEPKAVEAVGKLLTTWAAIRMQY